MEQHEFLQQLIPENGDPLIFCELLIFHCSATRSYKAKHRANKMTNVAELSPLTSEEEIVIWAELDENGKSRTLKTAPSLRPGWIVEDNDIESFCRKLNAFYPDVLKDSADYFCQKSTPCNFRKSIKNHPSLNSITDAEINAVMRNTCFRGCLRLIAWGIDDRCAISRLPHPKKHSLPAVCSEACNIALSAAKRLV